MDDASISDIRTTLDVYNTGRVDSVPVNAGATNIKGEARLLIANTTLNTGYAAGDVYMFYNDSGATITLTSGVGLLLRLAGTAYTGNRTLGPRGFAVVWIKNSSEYIISGPGVS